MANQKLTKTELKQISDIQESMLAVKSELGQLSLNEIDLKNRRNSIEDYLKQTQESESELVKQLEKKYGKGSIDLKNGEFIPLVQASSEDEAAAV